MEEEGVLKHNLIGGLVALAVSAIGTAEAMAQEKLTVAIGQRGVFENSISELGQQAGFFKKHGVELQIIYTQGGGETQQAVISGSADIGVGVGTLGVMGAFSKHAPIRIIGATMTGAADLFWYVKAESPIKTLKDAEGKSVAYSTRGSSTQAVLLGLQQEAGVKFSPVATGSPPSTFTQTMSGQIDVGWSAPPVALDAAKAGKIRIIARGSDVKRFRDQTVRVLVANAGALEKRPDAMVRYMQGYKETLDWLFSDPAALSAYAAWAGVPEEIAKTIRDEFAVKEDVNPERISGLDAVMADAIEFKFISTALSADQLETLIQLPKAN
ncbi:ABC transporter substrate-binding protein [Rhizobium sp. P28RR-XV]|uniref:ABC transporter substrate-binding protein n=1 Tax=Rhizobium sp. P28RR-XV TaxID=2726737 RepID=UPI0014569056|nr:ABC transporter substrate-binding protein [Rhizobium sp. P28RR-XV]NLR88196.1 ABC transporter substrate-binding protein [Rhizobium sp. P28RR-XV]